MLECDLAKHVSIFRYDQSDKCREVHNGEYNGS